MANNQKRQSFTGCIFKLLVAVSLLCFALAGLLIATGFTSTKQYLDPIGGFVKEIAIASTPEIKPDKVTIINEVTKLARLETAAYSMEKVVTAEQGSDALWGMFEDEMVFVAVGEVIAGIDLGKLTETDIQVDSFDTAYIGLPKAEIFVATLDNEQSYVANRSTGVFAADNPHLETAVRQTGEEAILQAALDEGILDLAEENAQTVLTTLFTQFGFAEVVFVDGIMPTSLPNEQEIPKGFFIETPIPQ